MKLEKFIHQNREEFDSEFPSHKLWDEIAQHLPAPERKVRPLWIPMMAAASVAILVCAGFLLAYNVGQQHGQSYAQETMEVRNYYQDKLESQKARLAGLNVSDDVIQELTTFDSTVVNQAPSNETEKDAQLRAIIQNFETRISIIEKLLDQSKEDQQQKTTNDEKSI